MCAHVRVKLFGLFVNVPLRVIIRAGRMLGLLTYTSPAPSMLPETKQVLNKRLSRVSLSTRTCVNESACRGRRGLVCASPCMQHQSAVSRGQRSWSAPYTHVLQVPKAVPGCGCMPMAVGGQGGGLSVPSWV